MKKFFKRIILPKLIQEETEHLKSPASITEIEFTVEKFRQETLQAQISKLHQVSKVVIIPIKQINS